MLGKSRKAKKPALSVPQPTEAWEEKANSPAVHAELRDHPGGSAVSRGRPYGSTFRSHFWFQGGRDSLQKYLTVPQRSLPEESPWQG